MNKDQLKKILRPMIKECVKEIIFEDGTLSTIISEVVKGTSSQVIVQENKQQSAFDESRKKSLENKRRNLLEQKRKMLDAIGRDSYNGVDLFEGTTPISSAPNSSSPQGSRPLDGISPNDPGVDISKFGMNGIWKKLAGN